MAKQLTGTVYLEGKDGETQVFPAGAKESDVPAAARKQITNPSAWADPDGESQESAAPATQDGGTGGTE